MKNEEGQFWKTRLKLWLRAGICFSTIFSKTYKQFLCPFFSFFFFFITFSFLQAIAQYFKGCIKKKSATEGGDAKPVKIKQVYSIRDIIKQNYQDLVQDEIPYISSDKCYLGSYQRVVTTVHKNMTENDLEEAQKIVNLWNVQGAPSDVQLKWVLRV